MEHLLPLLDRYDRLFVFDTETTGLRFSQDQIIQFSSVTLERVNGRAEVTECFDILIALEPGQQVPPEIERLTGITTEQLRQEGVPRDRACREIAVRLAGNPLLIAYNAHFDLSFLYHMFAAWGDPGCLVGKDKLDLLTVYRDRRAYPHKLASAIEAYQLGGAVRNSHQASDDAMATVYVMEAMAAERNDLLQYCNLFGYLSKFGAPKPKIRSVTYLPQGYEPGLPLYAMPGK